MSTEYVALERLGSSGAKAKPPSPAASPPGVRPQPGSSRLSMPCARSLSPRVAPTVSLRALESMLLMLAVTAFWAIYAPWRSASAGAAILMQARAPLCSALDDVVKPAFLARCSLPASARASLVSMCKCVSAALLRRERKRREQPFSACGSFAAMSCRAALAS